MVLMFDPPYWYPLQAGTLLVHCMSRYWECLLGCGLNPRKTVIIHTVYSSQTGTWLVTSTMLLVGEGVYILCPSFWICYWIYDDTRKLFPTIGVTSLVTVTRLVDTFLWREVESCLTCLN